MDYNIISDTDSYKASHWLQYPPGMTYNYAYFESRGGAYANIVFFGLQYYLHKLAKPITKEMVDRAEKLFKAHGEPFNREGWMYIVEKHAGKLPLKIKAVPEGTVVPTKNVLYTVESTDPNVAWLTSYVETVLSRVWYTCTVATRSWHCRRSIYGFLNETSDNADQEIDFKLHDFGSRGVSSQETAALGGAAHLINFLGTDTVVAICLLQDYYFADMPGFSIPAAEHSSITMWGRGNEVEAYRNMLKQFGKYFLVAVVSDSYDIFHAVEKLWGEVLKQDVLGMDAGLVIRPDSGDPVEIVTRLAKIIESKFGATVNSKGYKVLNKVKIIQGDGMDEDSIFEVYKSLRDTRFAADNLAVGMGGGLLQKLNRDTCKFAYKTSYAEVNGIGIEVYKDPVTDPGKKSKRGKLSLIKDMGKYKTVPYTAYGDLLETVFENGQIVKTYTLDEIRKNARAAV